MSSSSDSFSYLNPTSSSASLGSRESWQDIQEELPEAPQAGDSPKLFGSVKGQEQEADEISLHSDDSGFSLDEDSTLRYPAQSIEAGTQTINNQHGSSAPDFASFSDGNVDLVVGIRTFRLHKYKLSEFEAIRGMVEAGRGAPGGELNDHPLRVTLEADVDDVCNMLSVLYSPVYTIETQNFGIGVLKSTLRFATQFQHLPLRSFAIQRLEKESIPPIERIVMSRQSNVPSWMQSALDELCVREAPISFIEAITLGTKTFVEVAARREAHKSMTGHSLIAFKAALCNNTRTGLDSAGTSSRRSPTVDSQLLEEHNSALDHIITTAFSIVSTKATCDNGKEN